MSEEAIETKTIWELEKQVGGEWFHCAHCGTARLGLALDKKLFLQREYPDAKFRIVRVVKQTFVEEA